MTEQDGFTTDQQLQDIRSTLVQLQNTADMTLLALQGLTALVQGTAVPMPAITAKDLLTELQVIRRLIEDLPKKRKRTP